MLAATVAAGGDQSLAKKFVADVDDLVVEASAVDAFIRIDRTSSKVIDSKLYPAIRSMLPENDDGDHIHAAIKGNCARVSAGGKRSGCCKRTSSIKACANRRRRSSRWLRFIWKALSMASERPGLPGLKCGKI